MAATDPLQRPIIARAWTGPMLMIVTAHLLPRMELPRMLFTACTARQRRSASAIVTTLGILISTSSRMPWLALALGPTLTTLIASSRWLTLTAAAAWTSVIAIYIHFQFDLIFSFFRRVLLVLGPLRLVTTLFLLGRSIINTLCYFACVIYIMQHAESCVCPCE